MRMTSRRIIARRARLPRNTANLCPLPGAGGAFWRNAHSVTSFVGVLRTQKRHIRDSNQSPNVAGGEAPNCPSAWGRNEGSWVERQLLQRLCRLPLAPIWHLQLHANDRRNNTAMKLDEHMAEDQPCTKFRSRARRFEPNAVSLEMPHS
jgi:hypothetical protein